MEGKVFARFTIGPKLGQGSFGEIYAVRDPNDNKLYALKVEPVKSAKQILTFETIILRRLTPSSYFPAFNGAGQTETHTWLCMELLGPSLATALARNNGRLSLSTGIRTAIFTLRAIRTMHDLGVVHRDVKPSNILLRRNREFPITLIDFGLSRIYVDANGSHLQPRAHPGFRGTAVYASINAHMHQDLSRRDDLASWFYLILDILVTLPWKGNASRIEILHMKRRMNIQKMASDIAPQLAVICNHINSLNFEDKPDYELIEAQLQLICEEKHISGNDEWDWHPSVLQMDGSDEAALENPRSDTSLESEATTSGQQELVGGGEDGVKCEGCFVF